jgi:parallel beta-helix repeat protein
MAIRSSSISARERLRLCLAVALAAASATCASRPEARPILAPSSPRATRPAVQVTGRTLYVDQQIAEESCTVYEVESRGCGPGAATAYRDPHHALQAAQPGDTVVIRSGTFNRQLVLARSGAPGAPITIQAFSGETVRLTGIADDPALLLQNVSHVVIQGLTVTDSQGFGRLEEATHVVIRNNHFSGALATGTRGGLKLVRSHSNRILDNRFERGNDSLVIQESDRNLVAGNSFVRGRHSLISIRCGNFNVVRGNTLSNERQKAMEIYDCEGVSDAPVRLDATRRNLVEGNRFTLTREAARPHEYNGIQYAGQLGIVRRNVFQDNRGGALVFQVYAREALHNYGHRVYHNTFLANRCYAVASTGRGGDFGDIRVEHNVFYRNVDCAGRPEQTRGAGGVAFRDNAVLKPEEDPRFADEGGGDLRPQPDSPLVDAAGFLTTSTAAGSGVELRVSDARYFYDGHGIEGEQGDLIQLAGQRERAHVVHIDFATGTLRLDRPLAWRKGQGVALAYEGKAPDMGAFELQAGAGAALLFRPSGYDPRIRSSSERPRSSSIASPAAPRGSPSTSR